jgi:hypothetical protein
MYRQMYFAHLKCSWDGLALNCANLITANAMSECVPIMRYNSKPIMLWYCLSNSGDALPLLSCGTQFDGRGVGALLALVMLKCSNTLSR